MNPSTAALRTFDFQGGWNNLKSLIPGLDGLFSVTAVIGVVIVAWFIGKWVWDKRRGTGGGFPLWPVIFGGFLAGPAVVIPVILTLASWFMTLLVQAIEFIGGLLGA